MSGATRRILAAGATCLLAAAGAAAQEPSATVLEGLVVDSLSGQPVGGVLVQMDSGQRTYTGAEGRFRFREVAAGPHMLALLTADCRVTWSRVEVEPGGTARITARLAFPLGMAAAQAIEAGEQRRSEGKLLTAADIEEMNVARLEDVIRRVQPNMVGAPASMAGGVTAVGSRSRRMSGPARGEPVVVIDGIRAEDGSRSLASIHPSDVETLEVLPGAAAGWEYGSDGAGGVIRITTRRHPFAERDGRREACVVPDFPRR